MVLFKKVNGIEVQLTQAEETAKIEEWDQNVLDKEALIEQFGHFRVRRPKYISHNLQLEAIFAGFQAIRDFSHQGGDDDGGVTATIDLPPLTLAWLAATEAINDAFPPQSGGNI